MEVFQNEAEIYTAGKAIQTKTEGIPRSTA
jgi:hypothetical protein